MAQTQTIGQAEADGREIVPKPKRGPDEGNVLWRLYLELGHTGNRAFRALMASLPLGMVTFFKYTKPDYKLGDINARYFLSFRAFFIHHGGHDILDDLNDEQPLPLFTEPAP